MNFFVRYRDLLKNLVVKDLKLRYKNTVLGFFWSLLNPFLILLVLYTVFTVFFRVRIQNYAVFLLFGIVMWRFFANGTMNGMRAVTDNVSIIRRIYFPREIFVISSVIASFIIAVLEFLVFFVIFIASGMSVSSAFLWIIPVFFCELLIVLGIVFFLSASFYFYRDVAHIWEILLQAGFFACPIVYPVTRVPVRFIKIYLLNPIAVIIQMGRSAVLSGIPPTIWSVYVLFTMSSIVLAVGYVVFKKSEPGFIKGL